MPFSVDHKAVGGYGFPAACRSMALWEMQMDQRMHLERLKNIKMGVDNTPPRTVSAGKVREESRRKMRELERERIARENAVLMKNMYRMLNEPPRFGFLSADIERGRANKRHVSNEQRELMLKRLNQQNQRMLKMIIETGPDINFSKYEKDWKVTQQRLNAASKLPWVVGELPDVPDHARKHFNSMPTSLAATASMSELTRRRGPPLSRSPPGAQARARPVSLPKRQDGHAILSGMPPSAAVTMTQGLGDATSCAIVKDVSFSSQSPLGPNCMSIKVSSPSADADLHREVSPPLAESNDISHVDEYPGHAITPDTQPIDAPLPTAIGSVTSNRAHTQGSADQAFGDKLPNDLSANVCSTDLYAPSASTEASAPCDSSN